MTDLTKKIADARRLDAEATPGPWTQAEWMVDAEGCKRELATCLLFEDERDNRNAHLIAHARNHHAALWDVVAEADYLLQTGSGEAKVRLRAALARLEQVQP